MFAHIPITSILIDKDKRQRKELQDIQALADSIAQIGLINPITIMKKDNKLICGERRLSACILLGHTEIAVRYFEDLPEVAQQIIELQENLKRSDLSWQDTTAAINAIHATQMAEQEHWNITATAELLGLPFTTVSCHLKLATEIAGGNTALLAEKNFTSAVNKAERNITRKGSAELELLTNVILGSPDKVKQMLAEAKAPDDGVTSPSIKPASTFLAESVAKTKASVDISFREADAIEYMQNFSGTRFNFLHCDFPYGINHDKSEMGGADTYGSYADSPDIYWKLCRALAAAIPTLLQKEAHIMFWLSMEHYAETVALFEQVEDLVVYKTPLVWLKSCNTGIVKDPKRTPRNVTEFCLYMNKGEAPILKNVANAYAAPSNKANRLHQSEKPVAVLSHFFRMFVDGYTSMLDPTCGGGSSLRAADALGARHGVGLDLNPAYIDVAEAAYKEHNIKKLLNKKLGESNANS